MRCTICSGSTEGRARPSCVAGLLHIVEAATDVGDRPADPSSLRVVAKFLLLDSDGSAVLSSPDFGRYISSSRPHACRNPLVSALAFLTWVSGPYVGHRYPGLLYPERELGHCRAFYMIYAQSPRTMPQGAGYCPQYHMICRPPSVCGVCRIWPGCVRPRRACLRRPSVCGGRRCGVWIWAGGGFSDLSGGRGGTPTCSRCVSKYYDMGGILYPPPWICGMRRCRL